MPIHMTGRDARDKFDLTNQLPLLAWYKVPNTNREIPVTIVKASFRPKMDHYYIVSMTGHYVREGTRKLTDTVHINRLRILKDGEKMVFTQELRV